MFAVPGWSLGEVKTQQQPSGSASNVSSNSSRKRRRTNNAEAKGVDHKERRMHEGLQQSNRHERTSSRDTYGHEQGKSKQRAHSSLAADGKKKTSHKKSEQDGRNDSKNFPRTRNDSTRTTPSRQGQRPASSSKSQKKQKGEKLCGTDSVEIGGNDNRRKMHEDAESRGSAIHETLTPLQTAMQQKLISARFRHLNEALYTTPSTKAQSMFLNNPSFFDEYHQGFRKQTSTWPEVPIHTYIQQIRARGSIHMNGKKSGKGERFQRRNQEKIQPKQDAPKVTTPLPRTHGKCTVADLGCGDALLARQLDPANKVLGVEVLSYDLYSSDPLVTAADVSQLPLSNESVNIAVLCLALMGTNWVRFIEEAWRVLEWNGELWIAEIKSRFAKPKRSNSKVPPIKKGREEASGRESVRREDANDLTLEVDADGARQSRTDVSAFVGVLQRRGFSLKKNGGIDDDNKMFVKLEFVKERSHPGRQDMENYTKSSVSTEEMDEASVLKPCLYKTR